MSHNIRPSRRSPLINILSAGSSDDMTVGNDAASPDNTAGGPAGDVVGDTTADNISETPEGATDESDGLADLSSCLPVKPSSGLFEMLDESGLPSDSVDGGHFSLLLLREVGEIKSDVGDVKDELDDLKKRVSAMERLLVFSRYPDTQNVEDSLKKAMEVFYSQLKTVSSDMNEKMVMDFLRYEIDEEMKEFIILRFAQTDKLTKDLVELTAKVESILYREVGKTTKSGAVLSWKSLEDLGKEMSDIIVADDTKGVISVHLPVMAQIVLILMPKKVAKAFALVPTIISFVDCADLDA